MNLKTALSAGRLAGAIVALLGLLTSSAPAAGLLEPSFLEAME